MTVDGRFDVERYDVGRSYGRSGGSSDGSGNVWIFGIAETHNNPSVED